MRGNYFVFWIETSDSRYWGEEKHSAWLTQDEATALMMKNFVLMSSGSVRSTAMYECTEMRSRTVDLKLIKSVPKDDHVKTHVMDRDDIHEA